MSSLLNRIAWMMSLAFSYILLFSFLTFFFDRYFLHNFDDAFLVFLVLLGVLTMINKRIFLSKKRIEFAFFSLSQKGMPKEELRKKESSSSVASQETLSSPENFQVVEKEKEVSEQRKNPRENIFLQEKKKEEKKESGFFQKFFSENLLAKVGGILLFLGVLFLLQLVYTALGPVGKLLIGFLIGFATFGVGVFLDTKDYKMQSRALLGTGILINYLVILSGRFLLGDVFDAGAFLSEGVTFFLLIIHTIFAIATSLVYRDRVLLFFSFAVAYLNPFLIGADVGETPYMLLGYTFILSFGVLSLSFLFQKKDPISSRRLLFLALFAGGLLCFAAPFSSVLGWTFKLGITAVLSVSTLLLAFRNREYKILMPLFLGAYIFFLSLIFLGSGELGVIFSASMTAFFAHILFLLLMIGLGAFFFFVTQIFSLLSFFFLLPLLILLGMILVNPFLFSFIPILLFVTLSLFFFLFFFLRSFFTKTLSLLFFALLGIFLFLISSFQKIEILSADQSFSLLEQGGIVLTTFLFLVVGLFFSRKKELHYLAPISTFFGIITLLPIITHKEEGIFLSVMAITFFLLLNIAMIFVPPRPSSSPEYRSLLLTIIMGAIFGTGSIAFFGTVFFPGVSLGIAFFAFAVLYFLLAFLLFHKGSDEAQQLSPESKASFKNTLYALMGVSLSLFSLAIAFLFSQHNEVISAVWLFEATLLFFFFQRTKETKVYIAGVILMGIGFLKLSSVLPLMQAREYLSLIPLSIIATSLFLNLSFLSGEKEGKRILHDILHVLLAGLLGALLLVIIPSTGHGWSLLATSFSLALIAPLYGFFFCGILRKVFAGVLIAFFLLHFFEIEMIFIRLDIADLSYLKGLQYLTTMIATGAAALFLHFSHFPVLKGATALYLFVITTMYVSLFFPGNIFVITLYWGFLTLLLTGRGIQKNILPLRTAGLYILGLTVIKILLYDVWVGLDDAVLRIVALMAIGVLMIVLSLLYSKKYQGDFRKELSWENFREGKKD